MKSIADREENLDYQRAEHKSAIGRVIPEIRLDSGGEQGRSSEEEGWGWEEGEQMEYEFFEQDEGAVSN